MSFTVRRMIEARVKFLRDQARDLEESISLINREIAELEEFRGHIPQRSATIWLEDTGRPVFDEEYWGRFVTND